MKKVDILNSHLQELSSSQLNFLKRLYPNVTSLKAKDLDNAIRLCTSTISKNEQAKALLHNLSKNYPEKIKNAEQVLGKIDTHLVVTHELLKSYTEIVNKKDINIIVEKSITDGQMKTPLNNQLTCSPFNFKKFASEKDAKEYFYENGSDLFELGIGRYQDKAEDFCYINEVFFKVEVQAEVWGTKQDRGDKIYHLEKINAVTFAKASETDVIEKKKSSLTEKISKLMNQARDLNLEYQRLCDLEINQNNT